MARPTKYSDEKAAAICKDIARGNTFRVAALVNGIDESTLHDWRRRFSQFSQQIMAAQAKAEKDFVNDVVFASRKGDWNAAKFWLTHRNGDDWRPPKETKEVTGADGQPLTVKVLKGVSMDDL